MSEPVGPPWPGLVGQVETSFALPAVQLPPQLVASVPAAAEIASVASKAKPRADGQQAADAWQCRRLLGGCPSGGLQIRVLLDESGSVVSHADPIAFRHVMLSRALDALAGCCSCQRCTVELLTFGRRNDSDVQSSGPAPLTRAGMSPVRALLASPPMTGSMLGGAAGRVIEQNTSGTAVAMVISDFQLFDAAPAVLYRQLAAAGPGIAAVLRTDPVPADLSSSGLRVVQVSAASSPGLLADTLIDLVADNRGPLLLLPPPSGGAAAELVKPLPTGPTRTARPIAPSPKPPRRHRNWWWLVLLLIAILLAILAIHGLTTHSASTAGGGHPIAGQLAPVAPDQQSAPSASGQQLPPIVLPPPRGTAIRTVPAATVWIVDPDLAALAGAQQAIVDEVPLALGYQQRYGLSSDRISLSPGGPFAAPGEQASILDQRVGLLSATFTAAGAQPASALQSAQDQLSRLATPADRIIVILTAEPARWSALLPSASYSHPPAGQPHPELRYYLIPLSSTAPSPGALQLGTTGPHVIGADPANRGQLATALARSFVDGTDATWPQN